MKSIKTYYKIVIWSLVIAYLCFAPADEFKKVNITIPHFDKVVHFGMFFILGVFLMAANYLNPSKFNKYWLHMLAVIYGAVIEIIQLNFIYKRNGDFIDWFADIFGIIAAIVIFKHLPPKLKKVLA